MLTTSTSSGTSSREKIISNLVILTIRSHINSTMRSTSEHQWQTCHCSSQSQTCLCNNLLISSTCLCNSHSQTCPCYSQLQTCLCNSHNPCSPQYYQLHYQPVPGFHPRSLQLLHRHQIAQQRAASLTSRPFQKRMSQLSQENRELRMFNFLRLRLYRQQNYNNWQQSWSDLQEETFNQKWTRGFEMLLNVLPFSSSTCKTPSDLYCYVKRRFSGPPFPLPSDSGKLLLAF